MNTHRVQVMSLLALIFCLPLSTALATGFLSIIIVARLAELARPVKLEAYRHVPLLGCFIVYVSLFLLRVYGSPALIPDILKSLEKNGKFLLIPFLIPLAREARVRRYALYAFLLSVSLTVGLGLIKQYTHFTFGSIRPNHMIFRDKIYTGFLLTYAAYLMMHLSAHCKSKAYRYSCYLLSALFVYMIYFVNRSRSAYIIFPCSCILFGLQRARWKGLLAGLTLGLISLCLVLQSQNILHSQIQKFHTDWHAYHHGITSDTSVGQRLDMHLGTWNLIKEKPLLGWGTGSFNTVYKDYAKHHGIYYIEYNPHNEYLNVLLQIGVVGLGTLAGIAVYILGKARALPAFERAAVQGIIMSVGIGCFFNSWLMDFMTGYLLILVLATSFGAYLDPVQVND